MRGPRTVANNRLWLIHRPTGNSICIGSRTALGWETTLSTDAMNQFYDGCAGGADTQDHFMLAIEDGSNAPGLSEIHHYDYHQRLIPRMGV
jgi:hypothetical protein